MRETTRALKPQRADRTISAGNLAMELRRFADTISGQPENAPRFVNCLLAGSEEESSIGLYQIVMLMISRWAGKKDLDGQDSYVIEKSRKICDVMGWKPVEE